MNHRLDRHNRGFTIVEVVIVITVIGILAGLSVIAYNNITERAIDNAVVSDSENLAGLQTQYALNNQTGGKEWYSANGVDPDLRFDPSENVVLDVVANNRDYCIRAYSPRAFTYNSLSTAFEKESSPGSCAALNPSVAAASDSPPSFDTLSFAAVASLGTDQMLSAAISDNGTYVYAGNQTLSGSASLDRSTDGGQTWTTISVAGQQSLFGLATNSNGQRVLAGVGNRVGVSNDAGQTWTYSIPSCARCEVVEMSSNGQTMLAADSYGSSTDGGYAYLSVNGGTSWTTLMTLGEQSWFAAAISSDGTSMVLAADWGDQVYTSNNSGTSWTKRTFSGSFSGGREAAISDDGLTMYLVPGGNNTLKKSTNGGQAWTPLTYPTSETGVGFASSGDGTKLVTGAYGGRVHYSVDGGANWIAAPTSPASGSWWDFESSSNGTRFVVVESPGSVWIGNFGP